MSSKKRINLLPKDDFEYSNFGKFIKWAVSVGRWIIVITEFIVICAFLSRFYFDTTLANLFDDIKQKQAMVASATSFEENFRQIQGKIKVVKDLLAQESSPTQIISGISQMLPTTVTLTRISLNKEQIALEGYSLTENGLQVFFNNLSTNPKLKNVVLSGITSSKEGFSAIGFSISATVQK